MLNKNLYDCLVKLGADESEALRAAEESAKIDTLRQEVSEIHQGMYQLTRQTAAINDRLITIERDTGEIKKNINNIDNRTEKIEIVLDKVVEILKTVIESK